MLHLFSRSRLAILPLLLVCALVAAATAPAAGATGSPLGTAEESPIAVPFVGDYEMWCTDRNPAPGNRCSRHHGSPAIDIGMDPGTPLYATGSGTVIDAESFCGVRGSCNNGKGNNVVIEHADGTYSRYLHMAAVSVAVDQVVSVGQSIGTAGESGQSSSPHLHYDEHFPFGTRTPMGQWIGCIDGQQVRYPDVFGVTDWNDVPYGSRIVNEDFACLQGVDISASAPPRILVGSSHFGITPPSSIARTWFEVSVDLNDGSGPTVTGLGGTALLYLPRPATTASVKVRQLSNGNWQPWSSPVSYAGASIAGPTCHGLAITTTAATGTPDVDVMLGTPGVDRIDARGGSDIICAGAGNDTIIAGLGKDVIFAGAGNDVVSGGQGADVIWAQDGDDSVRGGDGPDLIYGGAGNDILHGTGGNDRVEGGNGDDTVIGGIGHDVLRSGAGDDMLEGRNGRDSLGGGNGVDILDGGNGNDRCLPDNAGVTEQLAGCER